MRFFTNLVDSVYNPGFYATMRERRGVSAVAHLLLVAIICAVLYTVLIFPSLQIVRDSIVSVPEKARALYPETMVFVVDKGVASVMGVEEPVIIPIFNEKNGFDISGVDADVNVQGLQPADVIEKNFIVDTITPFSIQTLQERNGFAWASKDGVYTIDDKGEVKGFAYGKETTFTLSKTVLNNAIDTIVPYYGMVLPIMVGILLLAMILGLWIGYLFFALIMAILIKIYYSLFLKNPIPYSQAYKTAIFAMTAPIFAYIVLSIYDLYVQFAFTAATLLIVIANTYAHRRPEEIAPQTVAQPVTPPQQLPPQETPLT